MGSRLIWHVHIYKLGFHTQKLLFCFHFIMFSFFCDERIFLFLIQHLKRLFIGFCIKNQNNKTAHFTFFQLFSLTFFSFLELSTLNMIFVDQFNYQQLNSFSQFFIGFLLFFFFFYDLLFIALSIKKHNFVRCTSECRLTD